METWVALAGEEGEPGRSPEPSVVASPEPPIESSNGALAPLCLDGEPPPELDGLDYALLGKWTERKSWAEMAKEVGLSAPAVRYRVKRPIFVEALQRLQRNFFDQVARGEYGTLALAKANAVGAFKNILRLARNGEDERVRLNANLEILKLAGVQPPKPSTIERPETLLDQMTVEELEHFEKTNEFPRRLADKLARVAATVLQGREKSAIEVDVEGEAAEEVATRAAEARREETPLAVAAEMPEETPDEEPAWERLPDETELEGG